MSGLVSSHSPRLPPPKSTGSEPAAADQHPRRSHANDRAFKCSHPGCGKDYLEEKHLKQHMQASHTQERRFACAEAGCAKAFATSTKLRRHAAVHTGAERFRCRGFEACGLSFRKHDTLQRHVRTVHLALPAYQCGEAGCTASFDHVNTYKRHVQRDHGELRFWCSECGSGDGEDEAGGVPRIGFTTMALLQAHLRQAHRGCAFCDFHGAQWELDLHMDAAHSAQPLDERKTVSCPMAGCSKTYTRTSNLNAHVKAAHEGFRFVCGQVSWLRALLGFLTAPLHCLAARACRADWDLGSVRHLCHRGHWRLELDRGGLSRGIHYQGETRGPHTICASWAETGTKTYAIPSFHRDVQAQASATLVSKPRAFCSQSALNPPYY